MIKGEESKMKKKSIITLMVMALLGSTMLSACNVTKVEDKAASIETAGSEEAATQYEPITIDNYGREFVIKEKPQKVLTFGPNCSELFVALGISELIVGNALDNHSRGPLPEYKEAYDQIPELTYAEANREAVLTSGTDFIYGIDWGFGEGALDIEELEDNEITVYVNAATTMEEIYQEITDLGNIFQIQENAEKFIADQKTRIKAIEEKVSGKEPVKVLVYDSGNSGVFTCSGTNFESLLISLAGGKNVFDDVTDKQWLTVSYEEVLAREPDIIVIHDYDVPSVEEKIEEIKNNATLAQLECVKNERFAVIELESVLPGDRMAYSVEKLAAAFYPEAN